MTEPHLLTASGALALMKDGTLTVESYVTSLLSRISARDHVVKAWAYLSPEHVLSEARKLDQIPPEKRGPLHGIAIGVKDVILTKDMPTAHNSPIYKGEPAPLVDAAPVIALRAAGALIFGKTTTTEFASTTDGGPSTNPHDPTRTPGGSSSGSGAAVGDFQVPIGLGTQTGGSTIRPGSFNGIYGFKPTWGAISREGLAQYSMTCDTLGLYARSVADLQLLAKVFQLQDDTPIPESLFKIEGSKIAFVRTSVWPKAGPGTQNAWSKAKELLSAKGASVEEIKLPEEFSKIKGWHAAVLAGEGRTSFLGNYLLAKDKMHTMLHGHVENHTKLSRKAQLEAYDGCAKLRPVWDEIAGKYDALFTPSVVDEAPVGIERTGDASFCSMWTILQCPALNVPGFSGENGLPVGLTLVGARYTDERVLYAAKAIGEVFEKEGGFVSKLV
ncbi:related to glu/asp-tRNA amidotransferase subunit A [Phialocephala subalpina]|uniref:Related to glu/asp-tRNA amidotransferase subunit A n=1 Tax=Phialocephala subalpina TaxID=576137 RepID=A0A1L7WCC7_9HELO|nr:related to glu/asp-tRNA amidotransferase subunit A [Phialocephala subalpina]